MARMPDKEGTPQLIIRILMAVFGLFTGAGKAAATDLWFEPLLAYELAQG